MKQFLVVAAVGRDRPGLVHELVRVVSESTASVGECRMLPMGMEVAVQLLAVGNWHSIAKLESELNRFAAQEGLALTLKRSEPRELKTDHVPYSVDVIGPDQTGILAGLTGFFAGRQIDVAEIASRGYTAQQTGAPMYSAQLLINVPVKLHVAQLREEFMDYCDAQNLDAILEPVKN